MVEGLDEPSDGDDGVAVEDLDELRDEAETLLEAAIVLGEMSDVSSGMDTESRGIEPHELSDAKDVCRKLGTAITQMLSSYGYFDDDFDPADDDTFA